ncbi:pogo transposable element with KRAB domain-like [Brachionus plicatilis]|uniref:Pogo transposable element with KRAB domain-like n=1 Tax=Brachionus plicatilis TaxID=10195 RepID=A0A3M7R3F9_BRAPC|nr:pogo transposable element with KRAB domain-like [Brachionus plicatilis]
MIKKSKAYIPVCELAYVPASLSNILQPADVCWFKLFKNKYKIHWNDWFLNDEKLFTRKGNIAGPSYDRMTNLITDSWFELSKDYIIQSFIYCGKDGIIPLDKTVDFRNEDDDFNMVFDSYNIQDGDEEGDACNENVNGDHDDDDDDYDDERENKSDNEKEKSHMSNKTQNQKDARIYDYYHATETNSSSCLESESDGNNENEIPKKKRKIKTGYTRTVIKYPKINENMLAQSESLASSSSFILSIASFEQNVNNFKLFFVFESQNVSNVEITLKNCDGLCYDDI